MPYILSFVQHFFFACTNSNDEIENFEKYILSEQDDIAKIQWFRILKYVNRHLKHFHLAVVSEMTVSFDEV